MGPSARRRDLVERLRYTFISSTYEEIDEILSALSVKENFAELCEEFFQGCSLDEKGALVTSGFFSDPNGSAALQYALYQLLGHAPSTFLLKHRITRVCFEKGALTGSFRIPKGVFSLPRLNVFSLRGIGVSRLPDALRNARELRSLNLSGNRFSFFPSSILMLPKLRALNLAYNRIETLPHGFGRMKALRVLDLKGNRLRSLPEQFHFLQDLKFLDLSMNRLSTLPDDLGTLAMLKDFRVEYNDMPAAQEAKWESRFPLDRDSEGGAMGVGV